MNLAAVDKDWKQHTESYHHFRRYFAGTQYRALFGDRIAIGLNIPLQATVGPTYSDKIGRPLFQLPSVCISYTIRIVRMWRKKYQYFERSPEEEECAQSERSKKRLQEPGYKASTQFAFNWTLFQYLSTTTSYVVPRLPSRAKSNIGRYLPGEEI